MKLVALAGRDPDADALADEIIAETRDRRVGDHAAILDLRIDQADGAELRAALAEFLAVDAHRIAGLEKAGVPLRHAQPQDEILLRHGGDGFAGQDDGAGGHRHLQTRPAVGASTLPSVTCCWITERSAVRAFSALEATLKAVRAWSRRVFGMVPRGEQVFGAGEIGLRLGELGFEPGDLRIERLHLQRELLVADGRDDLALLDRVAFLDGELRPPCRRCARAPAPRWRFRPWRRPPFRRPPSSARRRRCLAQAPLAQTARAQPLRQYRHALASCHLS